MQIERQKSIITKANTERLKKGEKVNILFFIKVAHAELGKETSERPSVNGQLEDSSVDEQQEL